jgi:hypothetical protein
LDQRDIGDLIAVADKHHPMVHEEMLAEFAKFDQGWGKAQFLKSAQHCFAKLFLSHVVSGLH